MKKSNSWIVQKSTPLKSLSRSNLTLFHFKLLDIYLARIDSHNPDERCVVFEKGELEKILNRQRMHKTELDKQLNGLFSAVTIQDDIKTNKFTKIGLFEKAECEQDENGQWLVKLSCTSAAMEYIFNVENLKYLRYKLRNIINLSSRYSYLLFLYIADNANRPGSWKISFSDLKDLLCCNCSTYDTYKRFNDLILKKAQKEIVHKTDLDFEYISIRKGRKVSELEFKIKKKSNELAELINTELLEFSDTSDIKPLENIKTSNIDLISSACNDEFSSKQIELILSIINNLELPKCEGGIQIARFHLIEQLYKRFDNQCEKNKAKGTPINNRFSYFEKMIQNFIKEK